MFRDLGLPFLHPIFRDQSKGLTATPSILLVVLPLLPLLHYHHLPPSPPRVDSTSDPSKMPKRGRRRKKTRTQEPSEQENAASALESSKDAKVPKSLIIRRGKTAHEVVELVDDLRHLMLPYTALNFQEDPSNRKLTLQQYTTNLALPMGISHILAFTQKQERLSMRLARTPEGPTMHFRIHQFSLAKHIKGLQKRPVSQTASLQSNPPVVVTNNFGNHTASPHIKLLRITFQNMFPAINVATVKLSECRRVVLFNLIEEEGSGEEEGKKQIVEIRHYAVKATPVGVHRRVRRLVQTKIPNLNKVSDIADYIEGNAIASDAPSDSEAEDDPSHTVQLSDKYVGRGNAKSQKSALKLVELGPRLSMELIKVEKGLGNGDVMYHAYVHKTPAEASALKERKERETELKKQRRAAQDANVERKRKATEEKREAKKQRKGDREKAAMDALRVGVPQVEDSEDSGSD
jgi:ribosome biogenesis protein SSF1/2